VFVRLTALGDDGEHIRAQALEEAA
jgi:hypothetical protein